MEDMGKAAMPEDSQFAWRIAVACLAELAGSQKWWHGLLPAAGWQPEVVAWTAQPFLAQ